MKKAKIFTTAIATIVTMAIPTPVSTSAYTVETDAELNTIVCDTWSEFCEYRDTEFNKIAMNSYSKDGYLVEFVYDYKNELCGDINIDGCVNAADIVGLSRILLGVDSVSSDVWYDGHVCMTNFYVADVNDDMEINIADLILCKNNILTEDVNNPSTGITETTVPACWRYTDIDISVGEEFDKSSLMSVRQKLNSVNNYRQDSVAIFVDGDEMAVEKVVERYIDTGKSGASWHAVSQAAVSMTSNHCGLTDECLYFDSTVYGPDYPVWYKNQYTALESRYKDGVYEGRDISGEVAYDGEKDPRNPQTPINMNEYHLADILSAMDKYITDNNAFPETINIDSDTYNVQVKILPDSFWRITFTSTTNGSSIILGNYEVLDVDTGICRISIK